MFLFSIESAAGTTRRLQQLVERVLHRLGDSAQKIWDYDEIESYIRRAARELAGEVKIVWDQVYLECLPPGMNHTGDFEVDYITDEWDYGRGNYTLDDEEPLLDEVLETDDLRRAVHTSPDDLHFIVEAGASAIGEAVVEVPNDLTDIDRITWDNRVIEAATHRRAERGDSRYELTPGEVYAFTYEKDGPYSLRRIRVPSGMADIYYHSGTWGIARDIDDVTSEGVTGTWGIPRRLQGWHPMGDTEGWGTPRRFYQDGRNMRMEYFRIPFVDEAMQDSELPGSYFIYLGDYAQWHALKRNGPGQDLRLAGLYKTRWDRNIERIRTRIERQWKEKLHIMGESQGRRRGAGPPAPRLPWQFGSTVRS
jgi:hypothetical protein